MFITLLNEVMFSIAECEFEEDFQAEKGLLCLILPTGNDFLSNFHDFPFKNL
jgi:hypothetical protein